MDETGLSARVERRGLSQQAVTYCFKFGETIYMVFHDCVRKCGSGEERVSDRSREGRVFTYDQMFDDSVHKLPDMC